MKQSEIFRQNAENCAHLAETAANEPAFLRFKRMEAAWLALANEQDRRRGLPHPQCGCKRGRRPRGRQGGTNRSGHLKLARPGVPMKILEHRESHIVKLADGSVWQIFPGDIDRTLTWLPTTELRLFETNDEIASHALVSVEDGTRVRVRPLGERWPEAKVKFILKQG